MSRKTRAFDWRKKYICFICDKEIKKYDKKFMIALEGYHRPINLYIHRGCYDEARIEEIIKNDEKRPKIFGDIV